MIKFNFIYFEGNEWYEEGYYIIKKEENKKVEVEGVFPVIYAESGAKLINTYILDLIYGNVVHDEIYDPFLKFNFK